MSGTAHLQTGCKLQLVYPQGEGALATTYCAIFFVLRTLNNQMLSALATMYVSPYSTWLRL